jgi:SSS family transporter
LLTLALLSTATTASAGPATTSSAPTSAPASAESFGLLNYAVLVGYLAALVAMGVYFSRREKTTDDYFLAGRRIPWWAAGLSIFGGGLSALTYMSIPALAYRTNWVYVLTYIVPIAILPLVTTYYVPFYRRLKVQTAYEYLERRFNLPVRLVASAYFVCFQFGRMAIMLYLPAVALATVTGLHLYVCILLMGVLATVYTVLGGIEAVIWTDVVQVIVLAGGAVLMIIALLTGVEGGLGGILDAAAERGKLRVLDFGWAPWRDVFWVMILGSLFSAMMPNTADQSVVQRYLTTRDERGAVRAAWASALLGIPTGLVFFFLGTGMFVFYKVAGGAVLPKDVEGRQILPYFVMHQLPPGLSGLVIAGIFAAAMSTIDNGMNAIASAVMGDFYRRGRPNCPQRHYLRVARIVTLAAGTIATGLAALLARAKVDSAFMLFYYLLGLFGGTLAGLFVLGLFTRRTTGWSALVGAVASIVMVCFVRFRTDFSGMLYSVYGLLYCVGVGYALGLFARKGRDVAGLTIYTMPPSTD